MAILPSGFARTLVLILSLLLASGCTANTVPTPAPSPSAPTPTPAPKPAASAPAAAKPAATSAPPTAVSASWQTEWEQVLAAAKKEGKVAVGGARGEGYGDAATAFPKAYPDIKLEYTGMAGKDASPKILGERQAGLYLWDVYLGGSGTLLTDLIPNKVIASLRPAVIMPDILDDNNWRQGFDDGWADASGQYIYAFLGYVSYAVLVNRDVAPASELKTLDDLLDPKWKGKIAWQDPREAGSGSMGGGAMLAGKGEDWYRKLLSNDIVAIRDSRMVLEGLARGSYAAAIGYRHPDELEFRKAGLLHNVEVLDPDGPGGGHTTAGSANIALMDNQPHPNAAKVFINWVLSKEGQEAYVKSTNVHSRRLDVVAQGDPETAPKAGVKYPDMQKEKNVKIYERGMVIAKEVIK